MGESSVEEESLSVKAAGRCSSTSNVDFELVFRLLCGLVTQRQCSLSCLQAEQGLWRGFMDS